MPDTAEVRVAALERRLQRSERLLWVALSGLVVALTLGAAAVSRPARDVSGATDTLRLRRLIVRDEAGRERIVIAAPLPDPVVNGRQVKRRTGVAAGIQFKDADGTERGGIASEDDGSFMFGIDDQRGRERAHLYYIPGRGAGVFLQGENGGQVLSLLNPAGVRDAPKMEITDPAGKPKASFPPVK